jgi:hypothetical protein
MPAHFLTAYGNRSRKNSFKTAGLVIGKASWVVLCEPGT